MQTSAHPNAGSVTPAPPLLQPSPPGRWDHTDLDESWRICRTSSPDKLPLFSEYFYREKLLSVRQYFRCGITRLDEEGNEWNRRYRATTDDFGNLVEVPE